MMKSGVRGLCAVALGLLVSNAGVSAQECEDSFDSTYDLIQAAIFENKGCTADACHGSSTAGGLDLRADASYDALIDVVPLTVTDAQIENVRRVMPGQKDESLLFINLAAATLPDGQWQAPLRPMPIGVEPLSLDELEAVREWIEQGAPRTGTVPGTGDLLDACLPPAEPIEISPLPVPDPSEGVQIKMPRWTLEANSENEVCFASYFDISDQVPEKYQGADGNTFLYNLSQIRQDPLSHHLIVNIYTGDTPPDDPAWGEFRCRGGDKEGELCPPTDLDFCGEGLCATDPVRGVVCGNFGPPDSRVNSFPFDGIQEASAQQTFPEGAFRPVPIRGMILWNSHAFNLTDKAGKIEAWMNYMFAEPEDRVFPLNGIFNTAAIFSMNVPAFEAQEVCNHNQFPDHTKLYEINSHTHQRGKRFTVYEGRYECRGGPADGRACQPLIDEETGADVCDGAPCEAHVSAQYGDCDQDGYVQVNDLVGCVNISLGIEDLPSCPDADPNGDGVVSVAELVKFVNLNLNPAESRDPVADLLYTNFVYNDPTIVLYDPPKDMEGARTDRTLTYCSLFDNGATDPDEVKRQSTSPESPGPVGGPCRTASGCTEGRVGEACSGASDEARHASCDTSPGAGDGVCDACTLTGGLTTEDEMFILMGAYYVDPS